MRPPAGKNRLEVALKWLNEWGAVLWAEKCRQFEAVPKGAVLPPLPAEWGRVVSPHMMPCVVWLVLPRVQ